MKVGTAKKTQEEGTMGRWKLSTKMIGGYVVVACVAALIGYVGITKINAIATLDRELFEVNTKPLGEMEEVAVTFVNSRNTVRDILIDKYILNATDVGQSIERIAQLNKLREEKLKEFEKSIHSDDVRKLFDALKVDNGRFDKIVQKIIALAQEGKKDESIQLFKGEAGVIARATDAAVTKLFEMKIQQANKKADQNKSTASTAVLFSLILTGAGVVLAVGLGIFLTRSISRPIMQVAEGLSAGADQVASASSQVSGSSQSLAEGASQQAAAIEETSSSIEEMASMARQNADNAGQANALMGSINGTVESADRSMQELTRSMGDIRKASEETGKIIKTIDEIAFQTNLLALNAAVEAARAGEAGAGFAVVADEVRNLAMRAAEAAKNTSGLIEDTVKKVREGGEIVAKTNEEFANVATGTKKVKELVAEIAAASQEQAQGVDQINKAVAEMDKVVQRNAASAEESASASEEMNAQAAQMKDYVQELVALIKGGGNGIASASYQRIDAPRPPKAEKSVSNLPQLHSAKPKTLVSRGKKEVRPDQVIPMEGDFKNF
jgi:methyl-accepting chemotaxis protein